MAKRYGLIIPGKKTEVSQPKADFTKPSIFGSESDDDEFGPPTRIQTARVSMGPGNAEKRQARQLQEKALQEDPTVFQYDELYDEIESKRAEEKKAKSTEIKKPRYIGKLLECAERRKIEYERRIERLAQKEREAEGDQFKDKESFVTSAYRKKLEELKKAEEREKREDYLEAIGDVTKQQDLGGFYRHLYEQKLGPKEVVEEPSKEESASAGSSSAAIKEGDKPEKIKSKKTRAYRKRRASEDEDDKEESPQKTETVTKKAHLQSNLDADSDFSIDSSSDSEEEEANKTVEAEEKVEDEAEVVVKKEPEEESPGKVAANGEKQPEVDLSKVKVEKEEEPPKIKEEKPKEKKDIWKKRTVGEVFDAALQRYYERKAARNG